MVGLLENGVRVAVADIMGEKSGERICCYIRDLQGAQRGFGFVLCYFLSK